MDLLLESGVVDQRVAFLADAGKTGFTVRRQRGVNASAAWTTPDVVEDSNCPGLYRLLMDEDTTITSGKTTEALNIYITHPDWGLVPMLVRVVLYDALRADAVQMNSSPVQGSGTSGDKWRGV